MKATTEARLVWCVASLLLSLATAQGPSFLEALYERSLLPGCNNDIVGLFCEGFGCYYNSDCYDGHCNIYNRCEERVRPPIFSPIVPPVYTRGVANDLTDPSAPAKDGAAKAANATATPSKAAQPSQGKSLGPPPSKAAKEGPASNSTTSTPPVAKQGEPQQAKETPAPSQPPPKKQKTPSQ